MSGTLRLATPADAPAIRQLYTPYVEETAITFSTTVPSVADLETKISKTLKRYPWLVCAHDDTVVGYAYASPLRDRDAYQWTAELSVYVDRTVHRQGVGRRLYAALLALLDRQGYGSAYGVVTLPNPASVALHGSFGFEHVGTFERVGYKLGAWHDVGWWRFPFAEPAAPDPPRPFGTFDHGRVRSVLDEHEGPTGDGH